ncbi:MAG: beta-glycosidase [Tannerella sp.]|jgi:hypothetical protein|nr:beta-glycosidase [Tannerella sp.]
MKHIFAVLGAYLMLASCGNIADREYIRLEGQWAFALDSLNVGEPEKWFEKTFADSVELPGTTDTNQKGIKNTKTDETTFLSRNWRYKGKAWYSREVEIPGTWNGKIIWLKLERTRPTKVWVDNAFVGSLENISTPQIYDLTPYLSKGKHKITILVDNSEEAIPYQILGSSHACTESTQTNWNGIIGDIHLETLPQLYISEVNTYPDAAAKTVTVKMKLHLPENEREKPVIYMYAEAFNTDKKHRVENPPVKVENDELSVTMDLGEDALLWDEFNPALYYLKIKLKGEFSEDIVTAKFGLRNIGVEGTHFTMNGRKTFLRGKHDAAVFPMTAHVAMDVPAWERYFKIAKEYGINHVRFHSWCPPEACFEAADKIGVYLQPECSFWGRYSRVDTALQSFLEREGLEIQTTYGNHASFVMFALGNELGGDRELMMERRDLLKNADNRHLYATGSNNYLGFRGSAPGDDYFTTCRVGGETAGTFDSQTRGSFSFADAVDGGYINHTYPNSAMNFDTAIARCPLPVISHETGQFQIYPDYGQIGKYTGVLAPRNLEIFKKRLEDAGMGAQAKDFFLASGKWSVLLYKADIEMDLRTKGMAGFQLLDLQDYPGQGSAYVGVLDAFMDSKGLVEPDEWRGFCSEIVPLFVTKKFCYANNEILSGNILISNYSKSEITDRKLQWELEDETGRNYDRGSLDIHVPQGELTDIGVITPQIDSVLEPKKLILTLSIEGVPYKNTYPLWVYPDNQMIPQSNDVLITHKLDKSAQQKLKDGGKVLWFPDHKDFQSVTVGGLFQTDYWNYRMFKTICENNNKPVSPGTMGILTDPKHPVFEHFPTDFHTNWQWFAMLKNSRPLILDRTPNHYSPIVQVIDNIERNHKLGLIFEFQVESGKLLVCMSNLPDIQQYPEAKQLYASILSYIHSEQFSPSEKITVSELFNILHPENQESNMDELHNISY